ncbi:protein suppressor of white apricot isoform X1 [Amyelois transitella]|uniref:protein suppressor of white apricot isoform X1 n=2 Tax=Amyelois transitella TaxID=680683 RepID=UPI00298FF881|nr:protein suppressor of white apricot isoform X1 [Amyelois transitella]
MSLKWTGSHSESGILRKSEFKEKKEDLFVFGYSCKLFRDDEKALHIDQGKHLIPWMGDETLKIDRYDARGALHDLSALEAPSGGYDWRIELTRAELDVEQLCDEERYRALHTDEDEEEMYKEEELKRLHAAGYGQVGFNYDTPQAPQQPPPVEPDEPFVPTPTYKALFSTDIVMPTSEKQNAIIEKTAKFIASQGAQMEILIKTKQTDNPQFKFLNRDSVLHPYYTALTALVKAGKWPEKIPEQVEEKPPEPDEYLHPSLASTIIESAPSIPSIHYKPSADCDYTMLISKMRGEGGLDSVYSPERAPGEEAPPGTQPLPPRRAAMIARPPVMYARADSVPQTEPPPAVPSQQEQYAAYLAQCKALQVLRQENNIKPPTKVESTGLSLMKNYNTDSETDDSDTDETSSTDSKEQVAIPPEEIKVVIEKMAAYVARNGDEFAEIVRAKNDPRFTFLELDNVYHPYYKRLMQEKRGVTANGREKSKRSGALLSFSIKKMKGPDPILPKPALPYESSSDEDPDKQTDKQEDKEPAKSTAPPTFPVQNMPPVVVYKMEGAVNNDLPIVKTIDAKVVHPAPVVKEVEKKGDRVEETPKIENHVPIVEVKLQQTEEKEKVVEVEKVVLEEKKEVEIKNKERCPKKEKRKHKDRKREYRSKSESREVRKERRSAEREERRERKREKGEREKRHNKNNRDDLENEIISLDDNSDDLVDLTGDLSDSKGDTESDRAKQQQRRRRAAEFLRRVGVEPGAALAIPANSLASAMVDTLESIRKKKADEEEKRRRRDKRRRRERYDYEEGADKSHRKSKRRKYNTSEEEESDIDGKKKRKKKDKKHKTKKRRRRDVEQEEEDHPLNIDLTTTLKELRTASPTKQLELDTEETQFSMKQDSSSSDEEEKPKKKEREYSEGEWSSDSEQDSESEQSKVD